MLQLRHGVELSFSVDLSLDIVDFIFSWLKIVSNFLEDLLDGLFVFLGVIPLDHGLVQVELHFADFPLVAVYQYLVHRPFKDLLLFAQGAAA